MTRSRREEPPHVSTLSHPNGLAAPPLAALARWASRQRRPPTPAPHLS
jgi:hypothetical protein